MLREEDIGVKLGEVIYCMSSPLHSSENRGVEDITAGMINTYITMRDFRPPPRSR